MSTVKTITQRRRERLAEHGKALLDEFQKLYYRHGYDLKLVDQDALLNRCDTLADALDKLDSQADSAWFAATSAASILRSYVEDGELEKIDKILNLENT